PGLTSEQVRQLTTYAIAGADGLFIAKEVGGDSVDLLALFAIHGQAIYDTAMRMLEENENR
ncbi:MAG: TetR/AcrR family transcriptional regulator, partial [Mycobacterium sp.]|nr:TetR/AcrR family transcriptional regulator [Mycobacterium sp.]